MNASDLRETFRAYFETIELCVEGRAYWALLHVLVVLPDVCAAMEGANGDSNPGRYRKWCKSFLSDPLMKPHDWYEMRCLILHQGRTRDDKGKSQYKHFRFSHPQGQPSTLHRHVETVQDGRLIHLDLHALADEIREAMERWFKWIETKAPKTIVEHVERHSVSLAQKSVVHETVSQTDPTSFTMSVTSSPRIS